MKTERDSQIFLNIIEILLPMAFDMPKKKNKRISTSEPTGGGMGSLGDLLAQQGFESSGENEDIEPISEPVKESYELSSCKKIVVRKEKKGRSGKVVTTVDGIDFSPEKLEQLVKKMRKNLGCGGRVEGTRIVLQGDIGARVSCWLKENGADSE
ncbi:MAG: translation initiation factor [Deltaproteobacteria bacterium]|nr:translation initiation factor [Deltaproteobacteria bacterium]